MDAQRNIEQLITKGSAKFSNLNEGYYKQLCDQSAESSRGVINASYERSGRREPEKLRDWLAKEIKARIQGGDKPESQQTSSGDSVTNKTPDGPFEQTSPDLRLGQITDRNKDISPLDALLRRGQGSWREQKTVIVDIDNSKNRRTSSQERSSSAENKRLSAQNQLSPGDSPIEEATGNAVDRDKSTTLAVGSQLKSDSFSAKQTPGGFAGGGSSNRLGEQSRVSNKEEKNKSTVEKSESYQQQSNTRDKNNSQSQKQDTNGAPGAEPPKSRTRLPTFGAIPRKLSRLPYFSYHGRSRNVDLVTPADRGHVEANTSEASGVSSSSSLRSLSSPSRIPTITRTSIFYNSSQSIEPENDEEFNTRRAAERGQPARSFNWSGYSNISNLFPNRPIGRIRNRPQPSLANRRQSSSLLNLNSPPARGAIRPYGQTPRRFASSASSQNLIDRPQQRAADRNRSLNSIDIPLTDTQGRQASNMRRQNNRAGSVQGYGTAIKGNSAKQTGRAPTYRGRPSSATGYLTRSHKSPSASSLHYNTSAIGLSPYGPPLLDPDCPVHGYTSPSGLVSHSKSSHNLASNDPDLLYENYPNYYDTRPALRNKTASLHSPTSPTSPTTGHMARMDIGGNSTSNRYNSGAYYNSSNRFSLYHPSDTGLKSQLAPTNEQLRRILGYQPLTKPVHLHPQWAFSRPFIHLQSGRSPSPVPENDYDQFAAVRFEPYNQLQDAQAIRAVDFHPSGEVYAVGSNSRALRICAYPADHELQHFGPEHEICPPRVLFKFLQVHRGSIYCVSFNGNGRLLATGSNDQTVHIVRYNPTTHSPDGDEYRLTMHDGTVRDLCFIDDTTNGSSLLLSAGGGDNKIYATDCDTITPFQSMSGHTQMVMSVSHLAGATFVSASYDKTIRFWDLRTRACTSIISAPPSFGTAGNWIGPGAPVCAVKVDPAGRLLASGHADSTCMLYDVRSARIIQTFRPHEDEIRTLSFSPRSYYLLTGGYDGRVVVSDLQGDIAQPLPNVCVAESDDKIVQAKWHPTDFTFATTSADRTATLWALPMG